MNKTQKAAQTGQSKSSPDGAPAKQSDFERAAAGHGESGILGEFLFFLKHNKKWWLLPILIVLLLLGLLLILSGTAAAPFIYTLF